VNLLAKQVPCFLLQLQINAKAWADLDLLRVVFVCSDGNGPEILKGESEYSRCNFYEIDDITDDEAARFLVDSRVSNEIANIAVKDITGGRILLLKEFAAHFARTKEYEVTKIHFLHTAQEAFEAANLFTRGEAATAGWSLIEELLKTDERKIHIKQVWSALHLDAKDLNGLLKYQVFARHRDFTISFQSRICQTFAEENLECSRSFRE